MHLDRGVALSHLPPVLFAGESDVDELTDGHHYEALYEVINPRVAPAGGVSEQQNVVDESYDDSFDSDDAFEEAVVRGVVKKYCYL